MPVVDAVVRSRAQLRDLPDDDFRECVARLTTCRADDDESLAAFLAVGGEAARRHLGLEPFDVQLLASAAMLRGRVVDMATGEGKTLVGFLVALGLALDGHRVHVLSANDYLAGRDAAAGAPLFAAFGLGVTAVVDGMDAPDRHAAYRSDVVYTTVHQVGFDVLRDRQRTAAAERVVPDLDAVVVDEIDAVLLDDAMVPLVIAGDGEPGGDDGALASLVAGMTAGVHYEVDGDRRSASFTEAGIKVVERHFGGVQLYAAEHADLLAAAHVALHAEAVVQRDVHYVVTDGVVRLVNDARGRVADRQRWPDGLHAAIERKEGLAVTAPADVLDQVLVETVVREYGVLTGMSGTAVEAAQRLAEDLRLRTGVIGTHLPCVRVDEPDRLYATAAQRDAAAAERVRAAHAAGRPVLVGTRSVGDSERFAALLAASGVAAVVLNAKNDAAEAAIVARAGQLGAVTVSTQMAGRGVDIVLGPGASEAGGLLVLGLGRYDSARLDRQLRGRSGRQGDPGGSVFCTSMDDDVVTENIVLGIGPRAVGTDGLIVDARFTELYAHAQRVAEGKVMALHRTTRRYYKATDRHRRIVLDVRDRVLTDDAALADHLGRIWGEDDERVRRWTGTAERRALAREVVLYHLDRGWSRHLNLLAEAREGIHLRVLGRQNPLDQFNLLATEDFRRVSDEVADAIGDTLDHAAADAVDLADLGLRRPSSTWTYMIADNPFGSEADRVLATLARVVRRGRPRAVRYT